MTGPEHYREAAKLASRAHGHIVGGNPLIGAAVAAEAQVHATLALVDAVALIPGAMP